MIFFPRGGRGGDETGSSIQCRKGEKSGGKTELITFERDVACEYMKLLYIESDHWFTEVRVFYFDWKWLSS